MRKASLFSGIGGIDLAAKWVGMTTVAFCEIEPFCQRVLRKHWPHVPIIDDVHDFNRRGLEELGIGTIDIISAGYPCQPFSVAGKRRGAEDDRHLWPEVKRILEEIRPRWFVGENVAGHVTLGLDDVLSDLESIDYTAQAFVIPAAAVRASHRRDRVFVVAYACGIRRDDGGDNRKERHIQDHINGNAPESESKRYGWISRVGKTGTTMADTSGARREECDATAFADRPGHSSRSGDSFGGNRPTQPGMGGSAHELSAEMDGGMNPLDALADFIASYPQPALLGQPQYDWEPPRVATGIKDRVARLKALGNAVDPLQIFPIMYAIKLIDDWLREGTA